MIPAKHPKFVRMNNKQSPPPPTAHRVKKKDARFELRLNGDVKNAAMARAKKLGVPLAKLVTDVLEREVLR